MKNLIIFGTGFFAKKFFAKFQKSLKAEYKILFFTDNDSKKHGHTFFDYTILPTSEILKNDFDLIMLLCNDKNATSIKEQLKNLGVPEHKISVWPNILKEFVRKYNSNITDAGILETFAYWDSGKDFSVFNQFIDNKYHSYSPVYYDDKVDLPYIFITDIEDKQKRLYYPRHTKFDVVDGHQVVKDILYEQAAGSPHAYIKENHEIKCGDVIVDAGVCEGNFSIRYVDIASKMYLFESDSQWEEPHYYTFKDYQDKTVFIHKPLSNKIDGGGVRFDDIISSKVDFIKMDIEGYEEEALLGGETTFKNNYIKCSICAYHTFGAEKRIKDILTKYGYRVRTSDGWMLFIYGDDFYEHFDFRRGIVYGEKQ